MHPLLKKKNRMIIHYEDELRGFDEKFAACNSRIKRPLTAVPSKVTCKRCKLTNTYREMLE